MEKEKSHFSSSLLLLSLFLSAVFACEPSDLAALQIFSSQLNSGPIDGWNFNQSIIDCCVWKGIMCEESSISNSEKRVVELDLSGREIRGNVSNSLSNLNSLRYLNLSNNTLEGTVPAGIFQLGRLEKLDLSNNEFSGAIPEDSFLPSIKILNISSNKFNGNHPVLRDSVNLTYFDVGKNKFSGVINVSGICRNSEKVRVLRFTLNPFDRSFPAGLTECRSLVELYIDSTNILGTLPDDLFQTTSLLRLYIQNNHLFGDLGRFGNLSNLEELDISSNNFTGRLPDMFGELKKLRYFSAGKNRLTENLPPSLSQLSSVEILNLRENSFSGEITLNCSAMPRLRFLDLGSNQLSGGIPAALSLCQNLKSLNLARNLLSGEIPQSFRSFNSLVDLSLSNNSLTNLASAFDILQQSPSLKNLVLTRNFPEEKMPSAGIQGFRNLTVLIVAFCRLSGDVPQWLSNCPKLQLLDLSWNKLEGNIPPFFGNLSFLFYLDLSNNTLTGPIPTSLGSMRRLSSSDNLSPEDSSPDFPFFSRTSQSTPVLQYNQVNGFRPSLLLSDNFLSGPIPKEFGNLRYVHEVDLKSNNLSGTIPEELSLMTKLEILILSHNHLTGGIPFSLSSLSFLSTFDVSYNNLTGRIPYATQFSTFRKSSYVGNPGLCGPPMEPCSSEDTVNEGRSKWSKSTIAGMAVGVAVGTMLIAALIFLIFSRARSRRVGDPEDEDAGSRDGGAANSDDSKIVLLFQNKKGLTVEDIVKSTNNFDQANIIGCGGFGLVFKATLPDGTKVAIKRLSGDYGQMDREFQAEVETLSTAQHRNLVLLQGYCKIGKDRLLIYSFMENGSLDYWLHENPEGGAALDWAARLRIARGAARGLAYLHQSCEPHILHRDIKSSNILLDSEFEAHLADFGLARLILPYDTHVTTDLVGTLGYIPPEYGQSSVATYKGDVYSFGVVLLELLTGRRPVDMCRPKVCRDLVSWTLQMRKEKKVTEVFDPLIYNKSRERQLSRMLDIACFCLSESPKQRPLTQQIVPWLESIDLEDEAL